MGHLPQAGVIATLQAPSEPRAGATGIHLVNYPDHATGQKWAWDRFSVSAGILLADSCKAVCSAVRSEQNKMPDHAACWSTITGAKLSEVLKLTLTYLEAFAGSGGALVAMTVSNWSCLEGKFWEFLDMQGCGEPHPKQRVLWNIETSQEVLSWPVQRQEFRFRDRHRSEPFALALSSTGKYLAEAGAGQLQFYAVP